VMFFFWMMRSISEYMHPFSLDSLGYFLHMRISSGFGHLHGDWRLSLYFFSRLGSALSIILLVLHILEALNVVYHHSQTSLPKSSTSSPICDA